MDLQVVSNMRTRPVSPGFGVEAANELLAEKMAPWIPINRLRKKRNGLLFNRSL